MQKIIDSDGENPIPLRRQEHLVKPGETLQAMAPRTHELSAAAPAVEAILLAALDAREALDVAASAEEHGHDRLLDHFSPEAHRRVGRLLETIDSALTELLCLFDKR